MAAGLHATSLSTEGRWARSLRLTVVACITLALLYAAWLLYLAAQPLFAVLILAVGVAVATIFGLNRFYAGRFVLPAALTVGLFIALPVLYTSYLGFTNYSSFNILTQERAEAILLNRVAVDASTERPFALVQDTHGFRIFLPEGEGGFITDATLLDGTEQTLQAQPARDVPQTLPMRAVVQNRSGLAAVTVYLPDGGALRPSGLRTFASVQPVYTRAGDGALIHMDGTRLTPDQSVGFYVTEDGQTVAPGWRVGVGFANFNRVLFSEGVREPMVTIFLWTVVFATLSVLLTFSVGLLLAMLLQWPHLAGRAIYRVLLILPYAVPAFISILVFRGLFNQNFGEINLILDTLFGVKPEWFTNGTLARTMLIIVNVWLGYPYMMLLAMGFLQGIPEDYKKAAALEGAGALRVFFKITLPQVLPPFLPMLIASFAFNFNNIVLVLLLTGGLPDIQGTAIPAGQTDILGSFTYRISFMDSGQDFGLAGAIATLIFIIVGGLAYLNFVALRRVANRHKGA